MGAGPRLQAGAQACGAGLGEGRHACADPGHSPGALPSTADPAEAERGVRWKSTIRDRSSGTASSVAFTPLRYWVSGGSRPGEGRVPLSWAAASLPVPTSGLPWVWAGGSKEAPRLYLDSQHMSRFAGTTESLWPRQAQLLHPWMPAEFQGTVAALRWTDTHQGVWPFWSLSQGTDK